MFKLMMAVFLICVGLSAQASQFKLATGVGLESRMEKEVNPGFSDLREVGQLFEIIKWSRWGALAEFSTEERDTSAGALRINVRSASLAVWGRYAFSESPQWAPFAELGGGSYFDRIRSTYQDQEDVHHGTRLMGGLGLGLTNTFWKVLLTEAELRGALVEDHRQPSVSFLMRAGFEI